MTPLMKFILLICLIGITECQRRRWPHRSYPGRSGRFNPLWSRRRQSSSRRDCRWTEWSTLKACTPGDLSQTQIRYKIPAIGGGRDCTGPSTIFGGCSEAVLKADKFYRTVKAQGPSNGVNTFSLQEAGGSFTYTTFSKACSDDSATGDCSNGNNFQSSLRSRIASTRYSKRRKRQIITTTRHRDVLFLVDESGSIGQINFQAIMEFVKALTGDFCDAIAVAREKTRVGVLTFDSILHPQIDFNEFYEMDRLRSAITNIIYSSSTSGTTCMVDALRFARTSFFTKARGARVNRHGDSDEGTEKLLIFLTDGCANCATSNLRDLLRTEGREMERKKISVLTLLVGANDHCKEIMESLDTGSPCYTVFTLEDFDELEEWTDFYNGEGCMEGWEIGEPCPL